MPAKNATGGLDTAFITKIKATFNSKTFVETGTYEGATTLAAANIYERVFTVELSPTLYQQCQPLFQPITKIHAYQTTSIAFLKELLATEPDLKLATFWLDAHWSGGITARNGTENTPLATELALISAAVPCPIILIDDIRCFRPRTQLPPRLEDTVTDYPNIVDLAQQLTTALPNHQLVIYGDIAIVCPKVGVTFSRTVQSMTTSLLNFTEHEIAQAAELAIAYNSTAAERTAIIKLYQKFSQQTALIMHLKIWYVMAQIGQKNYAAALEILRSLAHDYPHLTLERVRHYQALCLAGLKS